MMPALRLALGAVDFRRVEALEPPLDAIERDRVAIDDVHTSALDGLGMSVTKKGNCRH